MLDSTAILSTRGRGYGTGYEVYRLARSPLSVRQRSRTAYMKVYFFSIGGGALKRGYNVLNL